MAIKKVSDTAMIAEAPLEHRELGDDSDQEYDLNDLKKDSQNKDRMSEVLNQLLLKNVLIAKTSENHCEKRLRRAADQPWLAFRVSE